MTAFAVCSSKLSFCKAECWNTIFYFLHRQQNPILCFVRISILSFLTKAGLKVQDKSWKNRNKCKCRRNWEVIQSKQKKKINQLFIQNEEMKLNSEWLNHQAHLKSMLASWDNSYSLVLCVIRAVTLTWLRTWGIWCVDPMNKSLLLLWLAIYRPCGSEACLSQPTSHCVESSNLKLALCTSSLFCMLS